MPLLLNVYHCFADASNNDKLSIDFPLLEVIPKNFHSEVLHRILRYIHGVLNVDKKKLIAQLSKKSRDETFEPN